MHINTMYAEDSDRAIKATSERQSLVGGWLSSCCGWKDVRRKHRLSAYQAPALTADRAETFTAFTAFVNRRGAYRSYLPPRAQYGDRGGSQCAH